MDGAENEDLYEVAKLFNLHEYEEDRDQLVEEEEEDVLE
jgi:hypothetical protein